MKKLALLLQFTFGIFHFTFSQTAPGIEWQNTIGGSLLDQLYSIRQTTDGGYILAGISNSPISGDKTENCHLNADYWIIKTDATGNIQWQNTIGSTSTDELQAVRQTFDGGYILGGFSNSNISGDKTENNIGGPGTFDYWIVKTDASGNVQWENTIGGSGDDKLYTIEQTTDGGYILGGFSRSNISGDKTENCLGGVNYGDYWIVKTDAAGNIQWQNTIGGSSDDLLFSVQQTTDGGYILGGNSSSPISGDKTENCVGGGPTLYDYWIIKTDASGNILWQNDIGGTDQEHLYSVQQTNDGGYILGGFSRSNISVDKTENSMGHYDYWIVKTDTGGNIQWQNTIGGNTTDFLHSVCQTTNGDYILGGYSYSGISGDKTENTNGGFDYWIVKIDAGGNILWQNTIGGASEDGLYDIQKTADGGYILGGWSGSNISGDKTENPVGWNDYWIIKLYPDTTTGLSPNPTPQESGVVIFPNPAKDEITISIPPLWGGQVGLTVFDVMGKQVLSQSITNLNSQIINLKSFASGVYFMQLQSGLNVSRAKFVKQ